MLKKVILFVMIGLLIFNLTACRNDGDKKDNENDGESSLKTQEDVSLEVWIMENNKNSQKDFMDLIKPFLRKNSHIEVNTKVLKWNQAFSKITNAGSSGELPDIIQLDMEWVAAISSLDVLADMSEIIDTDDFIKASLDAIDIKDEQSITAVPWFLDTKALFYRKDACEKAEVDAEKDFAVWNSFKESLKKLNKLEIGDEEISALGALGSKHLNITDDFSWWIYGSGGSFLSSDGTKSKFNSSEVLEGVKFYSELALEGLIDEDSLEKGYEELEDMFIEGKYATAFLSLSAVDKLESFIDEENYNGNDNDNENQENKEDTLLENIGIAMVPAGPKGRVSFLGGSCLAVSKSSDNIDEAANLINFLVSEDAQIEYAKMTGKMPSLKKACENPLIRDHPMRSVFKEQMGYTKAYPAISEWIPVKACLNDAFKKIWDNVSNNKKSAYSFNTTKEITEQAEELINMVLNYEDEKELQEESLD